MVINFTSIKTHAAVINIFKCSHVNASKDQMLYQVVFPNKTKVYVILDFANGSWLSYMRDLINKIVHNMVPAANL